MNVAAYLKRKSPEKRLSTIKMEHGSDMGSLARRQSDAASGDEHSKLAGFYAKSKEVLGAGLPHRASDAELSVSSADEERVLSPPVNRLKAEDIREKALAKMRNREIDIIDFGLGRP